MNDGIKILLARMESHPEEFLRNSRMWEGIFNDYKKYLTEDDKKVFWDKLCEIRTQQFTEEVMRKLLDDKKQEERKQVHNLQQILEHGLNDVFKEAYTKHTLDTFTYLTKDRMIFKDKK